MSVLIYFRSRSRYTLALYCVGEELLMKLIKPLRWCAYLICLAALAAAATVDSSKALAGVDAAVSRAMEELHVPGAAVGVIVDGKVTLAKGYGVRELGR